MYHYDDVMVLVYDFIGKDVEGEGTVLFSMSAFHKLFFSGGIIKGHATLFLDENEGGGWLVISPPWESVTHPCNISVITSYPICISSDEYMDINSFAKEICTICRLPYKD